MRPRAFLTIALLAGAVAFERTGFWGMRATLPLYLLDEARLTSQQMGVALAAASGASFLAMVMAAGLAFVTGPRAVAALGALVAAIGCGLAAAGSPVSGSVVAALGSGLTRPCAIAAAAEIVVREDGGGAATTARRFSSVAAVAVLFGAVVDASALVSSAIANVFANTAGARAVFGGSAGLELVAALFAGATLLAYPSERRGAAPAAAPDPYRAPAGPTAIAPPQGVAFAGLAALAAAGLLHGVTAPFDTPDIQSMAASRVAMAYTIGPVVALLAAAPLFAVLVVAAAARWSLRPIVLAAAGLVVFGLAQLVVAAGATSLPVFALGSAVAALGEAAFATVALAYVALGAPPRAAPFAVAGWMIVTGAPSSLLAPLAYGHTLGGARPIVIALLGLLCAAAGAAGIALASRVHAMFCAPGPGAATAAPPMPAR